LFNQQEAEIDSSTKCKGIYYDKVHERKKRKNISLLEASINFLIEKQHFEDIMHFNFQYHFRNLRLLAYVTKLVMNLFGQKSNYVQYTTKIKPEILSLDKESSN